MIDFATNKENQIIYQPKKKKKFLKTIAIFSILKKWDLILQLQISNGVF